jgi:hypothetical protein
MRGAQDATALLDAWANDISAPKERVTDNPLSADEALWDMEVWS